MPLQEIDVKTELDQIHKLYSQNVGKKGFNLLVYGPFGSGKSSVAVSGKRPVVVHSFDPGGYRGFQREMDEGWLFINNSFENEDPKRPTVAAAWEKEFDRLRRTNFFDNIGTFVLDSLTLWAEAVLNHILKARGAKDGVAQTQEWQIQMNALRDYCKLLTNLPCDVVLTAHQAVDKDEATGRIFAAPLVTGQLKARLPALFDEIWVAGSRETKDGTEWHVQTQPASIYMARSRLARLGKIERFEQPNIISILRKAGVKTE